MSAPRFVPSNNDRACDQFVARVCRMRDTTDPNGDAGYCLDAPSHIPTGSVRRRADRLGEFLAVDTTLRGES